MRIHDLERKCLLRRAARLSAAAGLLLLVGCSAAMRLAVRPYYRPAPLDAEAEVLRDLPYREGRDADADKHRLDFYRPRQAGWPVMVFVHGGALINGDKGLRIGGFDIYGNVGRFYAARGVGVAVINYRLQPDVPWTGQADDVAAAVAWVARHAPEIGSDGRLFLSGHSAGAWLASRVALDRERLSRFEVEPEDLDGVIAVSGSGYAMTDELTWKMYGRENWWAKRFDTGEPGVDWHEYASVVPLLDGIGSPPLRAPPFLLIHTTREWRALGRQNRLFYEALQRAGVPSELVTLKTDGHRRMVLAMSREDKPMTAKILDFIHPDRQLSASIRTGSCPRPPVPETDGRQR